MNRVFVGHCMAFLVCFSSFSLAGDKAVSFQTIPSGAQVEVNGRIVGTTPVKISFPGHCFGRKKTAWAAHLAQPIVVRFLKEGYAPKAVTITEGPIHWSSFNGVNQYNYYLIASEEFDIKLETVQDYFPTASASATSMGSSARPMAPAVGNGFMSVDQVARLAFPAVVSITTNEGSGDIQDRQRAAQLIQGEPDTLFKRTTPDMRPFTTRVQGAEATYHPAEGSRPARVALNGPALHLASDAYNSAMSGGRSSIPRGERSAPQGACRAHYP